MVSEALLGLFRPPFTTYLTCCLKTVPWDQLAVFSNTIHPSDCHSVLPDQVRNTSSTNSSIRKGIPNNQAVVTLCSFFGYEVLLLWLILVISKFSSLCDTLLDIFILHGSNAEVDVLDEATTPSHDRLARVIGQQALKPKETN